MFVVISIWLNKYCSKISENEFKKFFSHISSKRLGFHMRKHIFPLLLYPLYPTQKYFYLQNLTAEANQCSKIPQRNDKKWSCHTFRVATTWVLKSFERLCTWSLSQQMRYSRRAYFNHYQSLLVLPQSPNFMKFPNFSYYCSQLYFSIHNIFLFKIYGYPVNTKM